MKLFVAVAQGEAERIEASQALTHGLFDYNRRDYFCLEVSPDQALERALAMRTEPSMRAATEATTCRRGAAELEQKQELVRKQQADDAEREVLLRHRQLLLQQLAEARASQAEMYRREEEAEMERHRRIMRECEAMEEAKKKFGEDVAAMKKGIHNIKSQLKELQTELEGVCRPFRRRIAA